MAFAGEDEECVRHAEGLQRTLHSFAFQIAHPDIRTALHQVRWCFDFVEAEKGSFALIEIWILPGASAQIPGVVPRLVVVAPVSRMLHGACAGDRRAKACGLGDEP